MLSLAPSAGREDDGESTKWNSTALKETGKIQMMGIKKQKTQTKGHIS